jgi:hypothetical protein
VNEGAKTGIFWAAALVLLTVAVFVSWRPQADSDTQALIGQPLFPASPTRWPHRVCGSSPLMMRKARSVDLKSPKMKPPACGRCPHATTIPPTRPSRCSGPPTRWSVSKFSISKPKTRKIMPAWVWSNRGRNRNQVGDEGVGRLVSFRGDKNTSLASVIIGNRVGESGDKPLCPHPATRSGVRRQPRRLGFLNQVRRLDRKGFAATQQHRYHQSRDQNYDAALSGVTGPLSLTRSYDATAGGRWQQLLGSW